MILPVNLQTDWLLHFAMFKCLLGQALYHLPDINHNILDCNN